MKYYKSEKLFFKQYPVKVVLRDKKNSILIRCLEQNIKQSYGSNWKTYARYSKEFSAQRFSYFLPDESLLPHILMVYSSLIVEIHKPATKGQLVEMQQFDTKYKEKLLYGKFAFVVRFNYRKLVNGNINITHAIRNILPNKVEDEDYKFLSKYWSKTVYVKDNQTLIIIKLAFNDYVDKIEHIRTYCQLKS